MTEEFELDLDNKIIGIIILCIICFVAGMFTTILFNEKIKLNTGQEIMRNGRYLMSEEGYVHPYMSEIKKLSLNRLLEIFDSMTPNYQSVGGMIMESFCYRNKGYDEEWYKKDIELHNETVQVEVLLDMFLNEVERNEKK